ncbi:MAG: CPBP family intramembrane metalloprotease [Myxococcales bacterium]|nr:CPBP family intramembrane metalloprotease [Myxococcales bacterium]
MEPPATPDDVPPRPLRQVALVYLAVCVAVFAATRLRIVPALADYVHLFVGGTFLFVALHLAGREPDGLRRYGIDLGGLLGGAPDLPGSPGPFGLYDLARVTRRGLPSALREIGVALGLAAVIFPPFAVGFYLWHGAAHPFVFNPPPDFASFVAAQLVVVGLPEEAFFRGFVQTRLHDAWPPRPRWLPRWMRREGQQGVPLHLGALILQAALFALVHVFAEPHPARLAVFFPGLVFGWLRAWRGGVGAAIVFHGLSNVFSELLVRGWLR